MNNPETVKEYIIELARAVDGMYDVDMPPEVVEEFEVLSDLLDDMSDLVGFDLSKEKLK